MDWVEGETLDKYIKNHINEPACLNLLVGRFGIFADWLLKQPFAHGDLKPDNIIVKDDGSLVIVDYDGMFVPKMRGQKARELGSPDFRHPQRTEDDFDEHIDDFAIVTLLLTIKAIALNPNILEDCNAKDCVLLHTQDFSNLAQSAVNQKLQELIGDSDFARLYAVFVVVLSEKVMDEVFRPLIASFAILNTSENLSTKVTDEDIKGGIEDRYGVVYSRDGSRLLFCKNDQLEEYIVNDGTKVICDWAFNKRKSFDLCWITNESKIKHIILPNSLLIIGKGTFSGCTLLENITMPNTISFVGEYAFCWCKSLWNCVLSTQVSSIEQATFWGCKSLQNIIIPNSVTTIEDNAFHDSALRNIIIPDSVQNLGIGVFWDCKFLKNITIPNGIKIFREFLFYNCYELQEICIPNSVLAIHDCAFYNCQLIQHITLSNYLQHIGKHSFGCCIRLKDIDIPSSVKHIDNNAFSVCQHMEKVTIHNANVNFGDNVFEGCINLEKIIVPQHSITALRKKLKSKYSKLFTVDNNEPTNGTLF